MARSAATRCARCAYDLTGLAVGGDGRCPECGQSLARDALDLAREATLIRVLVLRAVVVIVVFTALGLAAVRLFPEQAVYVVPIAMLVVAPFVPIALAASSGR